MGDASWSWIQDSSTGCYIVRAPCPQPGGCWASLILCACLLSSQWLLDLPSVRGRGGRHSPTVFLLTSAVGLWTYVLFGNDTTFKAQLLLMVVQDFSKVSSMKLWHQSLLKTEGWVSSQAFLIFLLLIPNLSLCLWLNTYLELFLFLYLFKKFLIMSCIGYCKNLQTGFPASSLTFLHFVLCMAITWLLSHIN